MKMYLSFNSFRLFPFVETADYIDIRSIVVNVTGNQIKLSWDEPLKANGIAMSYNINVTRVDTSKTNVRTREMEARDPLYILLKPCLSTFLGALPHRLYHQKTLQWEWAELHLSKSITPWQLQYPNPSDLIGSTTSELHFAQIFHHSRKNFCLSLSHFLISSRN